MKKNFFKIRYAAIILIAAGYGWAGGHYIPAHSSMLIYLFQFGIIVTLLIMGITFLSIPESEKNKSNWSMTGISILLILSLLINILNVIHGVHNSGSNYFDTYNNFASLAPVALLVTGNGLWVTTIVQSLRHNTKPNHLFKSQYNIL